MKKKKEKYALFTLKYIKISFQHLARLYQEIEASEAKARENNNGEDVEVVVEPLKANGKEVMKMTANERDTDEANQLHSLLSTLASQPAEGITLF